MAIVLNINKLVALGIQHSCYPNSYYNTDLKLVTFREVDGITPISIDFSTLFIGSTTLFNCNCGFVGCRVNIKGFESLPVITQDFYLSLGAVSEEISKEVVKIPSEG